VRPYSNETAINYTEFGGRAQQAEWRKGFRGKRSHIRDSRCSCLIIWGLYVPPRVWVCAGEEGRHSAESADIDQALSVPDKHFPSVFFLQSFRIVTTTIFRTLFSDKVTL